MRSMTVFNFLLEATVFGSVLILLLIAARALLRKRLGSRFLYASWLAAAIRLLLPLALPNAWMDEFRPGFSTDVAARPVAAQVRQRVIDLSLSDALSGSEPIRDFARHTIGGQTGRWLLLAWACVALAVGIWMLVRSARFHHSLKRARVRGLDADELALYRELCVRYGVKPLPVYYADRLTAPCLNGVFQPFIVLPLTLPPEHLALTLTHELCHHRTRDTLWSMIANLCCAIHWFNPLVWVAANLSRDDSELACDDRVTARLPAMDRLAYADVVVRASERGGMAACVHATGAQMRNEGLQQRVTAIIRSAEGSRWALALGSLALAAVLAVSFCTGESEPLPTVDAVPGVAWVASAEPLGTDEDAIACARRFLESPFVGEDTSAYQFTASRQNGQWRVEARDAAGTLPIVLRFGMEGEVLEYDGTRMLKGLSFQDTSYTHRTFTGSVRAYIAAFMDTLAPEQTWHSGSATADVRAGDVRLVDGVLRDASGMPVCEITLQVEPGPRVLYFHNYGTASEARALTGKQ